jgi:sigma-B regulation protein RsbU (phosphoserine phosphatase)
MSSELPKIAGWQLAARLIPARQTSGDFYDIYSLGKDRYGILVADVVDKGVGAALFMALCWALFHTYATQHPDRPDLVLQKVNDRLLRDTHSGQFVTLFYGVLDARKGRLSYCNAGHNPPYLFPTDSGGAFQRLDRTGVPLGILSGLAWSTARAGFQPGDLLVLYTDGVTEAENGAHEFYGSERMIGVIQESLGRSAEEVGEAVVQGVSDFIGREALGDDITLVVLGCGPRSAGPRERYPVGLPPAP